MDTCLPDPSNAFKTSQLVLLRQGPEQNLRDVKMELFFCGYLEGVRFEFTTI